MVTAHEALWSKYNFDSKIESVDGIIIIRYTLGENFKNVNVNTVIYWYKIFRWYTALEAQCWQVQFWFQNWVGGP